MLVLTHMSRLEVHALLLAIPNAALLYPRKNLKPKERCVFPLTLQHGTSTTWALEEQSGPSRYRDACLCKCVKYA